MDGSNFELVGDFMEAVGQDVHMSPQWPNRDTVDLRIDLIQEELEELEAGVSNKDMVEVADALTDLLYVIYGTGHAFGIDLDECFLEVHASNMSKCGPGGRVLRRDDGKILKPEGYFPPDLEAVLDISGQ